MEHPWLKHYAQHIPHALNYPAITIDRFLTDTVAKHPNDVAMTFNDVHTTYRELNDKVNRFSHVLQQMGVKKGDRIAFVLVNSPTYVIAFFAAFKLGAIVTNISVGIQKDELVSCLNNAGVKVVITMDLFAPNLYKVIQQTIVETVVLHSVFGLENKIEFQEGVPRPQLFNDLLSAVENAGEPKADISPADIAVLQYTSGSTGTPKAATLTHANIVASAIQSATWIGVEGAGNAAVMCLIPFFHVFGMLACLVVPVYKGYRMLLFPRMDVMEILSMTKMLETYNPISFPAVPSLWNAILSLPDDKAKILLRSLKVATSGGAPLSLFVHERFTELTGRRMMEAYGLSEASSATHMTPYPQGAPAGSIGVPLPGTLARIMDMETGLRECDVEEVGELVVKGPQMMRGYWNNKELTASVLRDGWFYTRDMARMDKDGFFYIVDRKDDLIISNGFNVYPGQIEEVLKSDPKVKDAGVIGIPDRRKGQAVVAVIALKEGMQADKEELMHYCMENMPDYRVPKMIMFRKEIPRDPTGKLLRRVLKQDIQNS
jgi:long-chain acyl-CoA synthetase